MSRLRLGIPAAVAAVVLVASVCSDQRTGPTEADRPLVAAGESELKEYCDALFPDPGTKNKPQGERGACYSKVQSFIKQCVTRSNPLGCEEQFENFTHFTHDLFEDLNEPPYPPLPLAPPETGEQVFTDKTSAVNEFFEWLGASTDGQLAAGIIGPEGGTFTFDFGDQCGDDFDCGGSVEAEPGELDEPTLFTAKFLLGVTPQAAPDGENINVDGVTVNGVPNQTFVGRVVIQSAYEITADPDFGDFGEPVGGLSLAQDGQLAICLFHSEAEPEAGDGEFYVLQELENPFTLETETTFDNQGGTTCEPSIVLGRGLRLASPGEVSGKFSKLRTPHWIVAEEAAEVTLEINEGTDPVTLSDGSSGGMVVTVTPAPDNEDEPEVEISAIGADSPDIVAGPFALDNGQFSGTIVCDASGQGAEGDVVLGADTYQVTAEYLGTETVPAGFSNTVEVTCEDAGTTTTLSINETVGQDNDADQETVLLFDGNFGNMVGTVDPAPEGTVENALEFVIDPGGTQTVTKSLTNGTATGALECDTNGASSGEADADVTGGTHPVIARFLGTEGFEPSVSDTVYVSCSFPIG